MTEDDLDPPGVQLEISDALQDDRPAELGAAIELVLGTQYASTRNLQRVLGISRARAAELILILEENGVVGPAPREGLSRPVLRFPSDLGEVLHALTGPIDYGPHYSPPPTPSPGSSDLDSGGPS